jgi:hypothetical protein
MLYKIAKEKKKKKDKSVGAGIAGVVGASALHTGAVNSALLPMLKKQNKIDVSDDDVWKAVGGKGEKPHITNIGSPHGSFAYTHKSHQNNEQSINHPMFTSDEREAILSGKNIVRVPNNSTAIKAHEFAHAAGPMARSRLAAGAYMASKNLSALSPLVGAYLGADGSDTTTLQNLALVAPSLPMLAEETRANARAALALHRLGGTKALMAGALPLLGSELSYMGISAMPIVSNKISKYIAN